MIGNLLLLVFGLVLLTGGAESLVRGASALGLRLGVKPIVIGLTVVAFGTSMPEFVVSTVAALQGAADIAVGNVVGSNIFNLGVVLGLAALVRPLKVEVGTIRRELPIVLVASALLWLVALDGEIGRADGVLLLFGFAVFLWLCFRRPPSEHQDEGNAKPVSKGKSWVFILVGLGCLIAGGHVLVVAATAIARHLGVSELMIGLTVVAAGTSLPELFTSLIAALRGQDDISVGNVLGSNLFNILFILGAASLIQPLAVGRELLHRDLPMMCLLSLAAVPILRSGHVISRREGALFLASFAVYLWILVAAAREALAV